MMGSDSDRGIIPRLNDDLWEMTKSDKPAPGTQQNGQTQHMITVRLHCYLLNKLLPISFVCTIPVVI